MMLLLGEGLQIHSNLSRRRVDEATTETEYVNGVFRSQNTIRLRRNKSDHGEATNRYHQSIRTVSTEAGTARIVRGMYATAL